MASQPAFEPRRRVAAPSRGVYCLFAALLSIADVLLRRDDAVLARALRLVEGSIGGPHERLLRAVVRIGGDAEARRDGDPCPVRSEDETLLEGDADALREPCAALGVGRRED